MIPTERLRTQHAELLMLADELQLKVKGGQLAQQADSARQTLSQLSGKLLVHLAMEDKAFYPEALNHEADSVRQLAERFQREMGGLQDEFKAYDRRWSLPASIAEDPELFAEQTTDALAVLSRRIEQEDQLLYPLVESKQPGPESP